MKLVVHELEASGLVQTVRTGKKTIVEAIRPHIYRHRFPTGKLKVQILTDADVLVSESEEIDISSIGEQDFFHGNVRFYINAYLNNDTDYKIKLVGTDGYSFSESSYVGWCVGFDLGRYPETYEPASLLNKPLDLEIWSRSER